MRLLTTLLTFLLLATAATSQDTARDRGFGRVTDANGKPWADAEVHLLHRPHDCVRDPAFGEELVLRTDDKGQFKAALLVGAAYSAWATGPLEADGSYRTTKFVLRAVARSPILLQETERHYARRVRANLHDSWNGKETLRWRATLSGVHRVSLSRWLEPDEQGILRLPRWPARFVYLQAWTDDWMAYRVAFTSNANYAVRYGHETRSDRKKPSEATVRDELAGVYTFDVPKRHVRDLVATDAETGAAIVDAQVLLEAMPFEQVPHRTNHKGIVHAVFAHKDDIPREIPYRWSLLPHNNVEFSLSPSSYREGDPPIMARQLPTGAAVKGRLLLGGKPVAGVPLLLEASIDSGGGSYFGSDPRVFTSKLDGSFTILGRSKQYPFRLTAALSPAIRATLSKDDSVWPVAPLAVLQWESTELPTRFGDVSLGSLRTIDVAVAQPDGTPTGSISVLLTRVGAGWDAPHDPVRVYTDRRGHVRVLVATSEDVMVHAVTEQGAAWKRLKKGERKVSLDIDPRHIVPIEVVDQNGKPVAGGRVHIVAPDQYGGGDVDPEVRMTTRNMCSVHAFALARCTLDANGHGSIITPLLDVSLDLAIDAEGIRDRAHVLWPSTATERAHIVAKKKAK